MSDSPVAYGIDFGTTNSSIAVAYPDRIEYVPLDGRGEPNVMRSVVYMHRSGDRQAGADAVELFQVTGAQWTACNACDLVESFHGTRSSDCSQFEQGGVCGDSRLVSGIKSSLSHDNFVSTHSWATDFSLPDLVAVLMRRLKSEADRHIGADVRRVVVGHPVVFVGAEGPYFEKRQAVAEARLREAALMAGFDEVVLYEEPAAAVIGEDLAEGLVLATDFGGGTFDVAIINFTPDGGDVIALAGAPVGGQDIDRMIFDAKVAPALHLSEEFELSPGALYPLPNWLRDGMATLNGLQKLLRQRFTAPTLQAFIRAPGGERLAPIERIIFGGYGYQFHSAIEDAKIALSTHPTASIEFHRPGIDLAIPVSRSELETLLSPIMETVEKEIRVALDLAGARAEDIGLVIRTGGTSSVPAFAGLLEQMFGVSVVVERAVYTTVVDGLAKYAQQLWA